VLDSTLNNIQYAAPSIDEIYGLNTYYRFNITSYINAMLTNNNVADVGFFLLENKDVLQVNRAVIGDSKQPLFKTQLLLTTLIINNKNERQIFINPGIYNEFCFAAKSFTEYE